MIAGLGLGVVGSIGGLIGSFGANKRLQELISQDPVYQKNPLAASRLALAQNLLNARAPGAAYAQANIYGSQANTMAGVERNATDSSQALAANAAAQANTNAGFEKLSEQEAQDYQRRYGNYVGAEEGEIQEGDKAYQDQVRRFNDLAQIRGAQSANTANAWKSFSNMGYGLANFGLSGGFGGGKPTPPTPAAAWGYGGS